MRLDTVGVKELCGAIAPDGWLRHHTQDRFLRLGKSFLDPGAGEAERFFARRSLRSSCSAGDEWTLAQELVCVDLRAIAHAASVMYASNIGPSWSPTIG